jgi:hypothetical protein
MPPAFLRWQHELRLRRRGGISLRELLRRRRLRTACLAALLLVLASPAPEASAFEKGPPSCADACHARLPDADNDPDSTERLRPGGRAPSVTVVREGRPDAPPRPPMRRLPQFAIPSGTQAALDARGSGGRPGDGQDVPTCRDAGRWCLAHATSTSPD